MNKKFLLGLLLVWGQLAYSYTPRDIMGYIYFSLHGSLPPSWVSVCDYPAWFFYSGLYNKMKKEWIKAEAEGLFDRNVAKFLIQEDKEFSKFAIQFFNKNNHYLATVWIPSDLSPEQMIEKITQYNVVDLSPIKDDLQLQYQMLKT